MCNLKADFIRVPYVIESEEEFKQKLEEDKMNFLVYGSNFHLSLTNISFSAPKSVRRQYNKRNALGFQKRLEREIVDPWLHEVRRKARIATLVRKREEAITRETYRREIAEKRAKDLEKKQIEYLKKQEYWNETLGGWLRQNNRFRKLREKYVDLQAETRSKARYFSRFPHFCSSLAYPQARISGSS